MAGGIEMFRSEAMSLMQLLVPAEAAHAAAAAAGSLGALQFKDLNEGRPASQRAFASHVKRCDEMARTLRFLDSQLLATPGAAFSAPSSSVPCAPPAATEPLDALEARLADLEHRVLEANAGRERVSRAVAELVELRAVLDVGGMFFSAARSAAAAASLDDVRRVRGGNMQGDLLPPSSSVAAYAAGGVDAPLLTPAPPPADESGGGGAFGASSSSASTAATAAAAAAAASSRRLGFIAGTVADSRRAGFERLLFRATRGNLLYRDAPVGRLCDPATGDEADKSVFVVFFAGERARAKALKICEAYGANRYPYPGGGGDEPRRAAAMAAEVDARLRELRAAVDAGDADRGALLSAVAAGISGWSARFAKEKAIYHTLNKFSVDVTRKVLVGEAWCPVRARPAVAAALRAAANAALSSGGSGAAGGGVASGAAPLPAAAPGLGGGSTVVFQPMLTYEQPPTHFATDKVSGAFQAIVDAYGVARYREANPALLTIVTFPFLFAVMFGDVGHALLMLLFSSFLVLKEKKLAASPLGDIGEMAFGGRYVLLLMSLFSLVTGLYYNEFFSIPMSIFGSGKWACPTDATLTSPSHMRFDRTLCPAAFSQGLARLTKGAGKHERALTYGAGVDPAWHGARTELQFLNSVKMKMSIVLGVVQMNAGIAMSLLNQRSERDRLSTLTEFIPQVIFLNALFGYLCFLILLKWATGSTADLYHTLIYMFLSPGDAGLTCKGGCLENRMFHGQGFLQVLLLLAAFVSVPWMLVPKPLILKKRWEERAGASALYRRSNGNGGGGSSSAAANGDNDDDGGERGGLLGRNNAPDSSGGGGGGGAHGGGHGDGDGEFDFGEVAVHQMIHTIEFVLGAVSNTASYLRLWALSLAHSQLSAVFYDRVLMAGVRASSPAALFVAFFVFAAATLGVLMVMETLSAFLHALRLHWVEFQNKFFRGDGHAFAPFVLPSNGASVLGVVA